jgi:hypothetical protein
MAEQNTGNTKRFKDTKVGKFFKEKAPHILDLVGDILPDQGGLGVVKNILQKDETIDPDTKQMLHNHLVEAYKLEVSDRNSARLRETRMMKAGAVDWMFNVTGLTGLFCFVFLVYAIVYVNVPINNEKIFIHLIGICEGIVISIFGYFFGSSLRKN